ncbi:hypothetical protein EZS27_044127, partial [termite gut metagenome]
YPGKWPNRFRDAWERLLQFNKQKTFAMYQESVMVPMGDWAKGGDVKIKSTELLGSSFKTSLQSPSFMLVLIFILQILHFFIAFLI